MQVPSLSDFHRNQQFLLLNNRIKQVKVGWFTMIQMPQHSISNYTKINEKKSNAFLKALKIIEDI